MALRNLIMCRQRSHLPCSRAVLKRRVACCLLTAGTSIFFMEEEKKRKPETLRIVFKDLGKINYTLVFQRFSRVKMQIISAIMTL